MAEIEREVSSTLEKILEIRKFLWGRKWNWQLCISTYVDLNNHYSKPVKILVFVRSGFNLIWHGFCTKSTSEILLLGQETEIKTKFCRQVLPYRYEQSLIICKNAETFGVLFSKYSKSLHDIYTKLRVAITNWNFEDTKQ